MVNFKRNNAVVALAGLLMVTLTLSSCDSLRQKFTRKKKKGDVEAQSFVPVLEPQEYPAPEFNPQQNYKGHYALIKAWYTDLWTAIDDKSTPKYIHYILSQITNHIEQMKKLVDEQTQADLVKLAKNLDYYNFSLNESWQVRNVSRIRSDLIQFHRFLLTHLRADKIKGHFVTLQEGPALVAKSK